jgi:hypothetical protein
MDFIECITCYLPPDVDSNKLLKESMLENYDQDLDSDNSEFINNYSQLNRMVHMVFRYSTDFGKNETEVLKHAANYLEPAQSEQLLELLASTQLKVVYQPYDWSINI